jgi:dethiobiotin synthetase
MMGHGCFITGTDTSVGKTFVAAAIAGALRSGGADVGVMKPVESGCADRDGRLVPADALALKEAAGATDPIDTINPYRFAAPVAPNIAARLEGKEIDLSIIKGLYGEMSAAHDIMIVEGAGGLLSPVTDSKSTADLAALLGLPLIVVAPSMLGCINHTLLTLRAAEQKGIPVLGIILNHPSPPDSGGAADKSLQYNLEEIKRLAEVPVLGEMPYLEKGTTVEAGKYIDLEVF